MPARLSLKKNIAWNSSGSLVYLSLQWLVNYLVVILLGFENAGIFSLATAIASIGFASALYGIRGYQVSDVSRKYSDKSYIVTRLVTSIASVVGVLIYLAFLQYNVYTTLCIVIYLLFKISEAYVDVYHGIIQRAMRMDYIGKSFIIRGFVTSIAFIATAMVTNDLLTALVSQALLSLALIILYDQVKASAVSGQRGTTSTKTIAQLLLECFPLALFALLSNLTTSIPRIKLESMEGSEILGIYSSIAIPTAIIPVVAGFIFSPVLTIFAEHVNKKNFRQFNKLFFKVLRHIIILSIVGIVAGVLFGSYGLTLLFGSKIQEYVYLFNPVLLLSCLMALSWYIGLMLTVLREFRGLIIATVASVIVAILSSDFFIKEFGANGASFVLILSTFLQIGIMSLYIHTKIKKLKSE